MTTLCEKCFPNYEYHEIKTWVPLSPCNQCGRFDDREHGGLRCHLFSSDPRIPENNCIIEEADDKEVGIYGGVWTIEGGFVFDNSEQRELFRAGIMDAFSIVADNCKVYFTDEIPKENCNEE